ncbi:MAG: hypothetical protein DI585_00830 [Pseudomonas fluorescens]|nr:MAG: hypothetical protein DI585_00830 [Pseudomonas fluorescens]
MNPLHLTTRQLFLLLALLGAGLSLSGFVLEYGFGVIPCKMCWWQRYAHWAVTALALFGTTTRWPRWTLSAIIAVTLGGLGIALWQFAAQHGWLPFPAACGTSAEQALASADDLLTSMNRVKIVPCDQEGFKLFGLSLAGWNIPASLAVISLSIFGICRSRILK